MGFCALTENMWKREYRPSVGARGCTVLLLHYWTAGQSIPVNQPLFPRWTLCCGFLDGYIYFPLQPSTHCLIFCSPKILEFVLDCIFFIYFLATSFLSPVIKGFPQGIVLTPFKLFSDSCPGYPVYRILVKHFRLLEVRMITHFCFESFGPLIHSMPRSWSTSLKVKGELSSYHLLL